MDSNPQNGSPPNDTAMTDSLSTDHPPPVNESNGIPSNGNFSNDSPSSGVDLWRNFINQQMADNQLIDYFPNAGTSNDNPSNNNPKRDRLSRKIALDNELAAQFLNLAENTPTESTMAEGFPNDNFQNNGLSTEVIKIIEGQLNGRASNDPTSNGSPSDDDATLPDGVTSDTSDSKVDESASNGASWDKSDGKLDPQEPLLLPKDFTKLELKKRNKLQEKVASAVTACSNAQYGSLDQLNFKLQEIDNKLALSNLEHKVASRKDVSDYRKGYLKFRRGITNHYRQERDNYEKEKVRVLQELEHIQ
ncbi:hypothetical protein AJ79_07942 [Helicocarpus griseus UAMH5409]|uniref:Uncharacterized protein n=1 Tax=Helicocarpus griseus UAMH5409 TaxID=1447875 RepID=A0A2B7WX96_9EURO|nr:hypothetical protein AJ79_07942 [Helicocarpus griseus UAMH5409]